MNTNNLHVGTKIQSNDFQAVITFLTEDKYYLMYEDINGKWKDIITTEYLCEMVDDGVWAIE